MKITLSKLRKLHACYTDEQMLEISGGKKSMELIDIMQLDIPAQDRVWVACYCLPKRLRMEFSYMVAKRALSRIEKPDPRSVDALKVLRRYIDGEATERELNTAARVTCTACAAAYEAYEADATRMARAACTEAYVASSVTRAVALAAEMAAALVAEMAAAHMAERHQQIKDIIQLLESED